MSNDEVHASLPLSYDSAKFHGNIQAKGKKAVFLRYSTSDIDNSILNTPVE
jgi:hypothetical protein